MNNEQLEDHPAAALPGRQSVGPALGVSGADTLNTQSWGGGWQHLTSKP